MERKEYVFMRINNQIAGMKMRGIVNLFELQQVFHFPFLKSILLRCEQRQKNFEKFLKKC